MALIPVKDEIGLYRDSESGAIINANESKYKKYLSQRERAIQKLEKQKRLENDINNLKQEMSEIKGLLRELINGNTK